MGSVVKTSRQWTADGVAQFAQSVPVVLDQLVLARADHRGVARGALQYVIVDRADEVAMLVRVGGSLEDGHQRFAVHLLGHWQSGRGQESGRDVGQLDQGVGLEALFETGGPGDDQRYADQALVEAAALGSQPVVAQRFAVVGGEDNDRVFALVCLVEDVQQAADVFVDQHYKRSADRHHLFSISGGGGNGGGGRVPRRVTMHVTFPPGVNLRYECLPGDRHGPVSHVTSFNAMMCGGQANRCGRGDMGIVPGGRRRAV